MAGKENKLPPPYLPPNYVTLDMLRERYLKAQEQKRLASEKEERERAAGREGDSKKREKEAAVERENLNSGEKEVALEVPKVQNKNSSATASSDSPVKTHSQNKWRSKKERDNRKRTEKEVKENAEMLSKISVAAPSHLVETDRLRESEMEEGENEEKNGDYGLKIKGKKKNRKKKKAKADETLGRSVEKVPEAVTVDEGEKETVAVNGRVWVKRKVVVVVNPRAEIEDKFGDLSVRDRKEAFAGGTRSRKFGNVLSNPTAENDRGIGNMLMNNEKGSEVKDDPMAKNGRRRGDLSKSDKRGGSGKHFKGTGRINCGKMKMDSSLVWVRKEDKADACVTGNCLEGVLEKAGEKEKKPGRGRA